jgi:hypothetical protein
MMARQDYERLVLSGIPPDLHAAARKAFARGDVERFLGYASNEAGLNLVQFNQAAMQARGVYERALCSAFLSTRTNHRHWSLAELQDLFAVADRARLRACGDPLPGPGPFAIYRGVAGLGQSRRIRGLSWTGSRDRAAWFAVRFGLPCPGVYCLTVPEAAVLLYTNERKEDEFIVLLPQSARPVRLEA